MSTRPPYTRGPWVVSPQTEYDDEDGEFYEVPAVFPASELREDNPDAASPVATIDTVWFEWEANARLIAAAPEMLEALRTIPFPSPMTSAAEHYRRFYDWHRTVVDPLIAKAEGSND